MFEKKIKAKKDSIFYSAIVRVAGEKITVETDDLTVTKSGPFPFVVLAEIRKELEKDRLFLIINGSRIDVYPSGMILTGLKGYKLENREACIF